MLLKGAAGHGSADGEHRLRYVQIGSISGEIIPFAAGLLRSSGVEMLGSGLGSLSMARILEALGTMYTSAKAAGLKIETDAVDLRDVETNWGRMESGRRIVFVT